MRDSSRRGLISTTGVRATFMPSLPSLVRAPGLTFVTGAGTQLPSRIEGRSIGPVHAQGQVEVALRRGQPVYFPIFTGGVLLDIDIRGTIGAALERHPAAHRLAIDRVDYEEGIRSGTLASPRAVVRPTVACRSQSQVRRSGRCRARAALWAVIRPQSPSV